MCFVCHLLLSWCVVIYLGSAPFVSLKIQFCKVFLQDFVTMALKQCWKTVGGTAISKKYQRVFQSKELFAYLNSLSWYWKPFTTFFQVRLTSLSWCTGVKWFVMEGYMASVFPNQFSTGADEFLAPPERTSWGMSIIVLVDSYSLIEPPPIEPPLPF